MKSMGAKFAPLAFMAVLSQAHIVQVILNSIALSIVLALLLCLLWPVCWRFMAIAHR